MKNLTKKLIIALLIAAPLTAQTSAVKYSGGAFTAITGAFTNKEATAINSAGTIVGNGFSYSSGGVLSGLSIEAAGINSSGKVSGYGPVSSGAIHAQTYDGSLQDLGTLGGQNSWALAINDSGVVVGCSQTTGNAAVHAFSYSSGTMTDLGVLGSGQMSCATAINSGGVIAGWSTTAAGSATTRAFKYSGGTMTDISGGNESWAHGINTAGVVVGCVYAPTKHAFYYDSSVHDIGALGSSGNESCARGINDSNVIVGWSVTDTGATHAFTYTSPTMTDLGTLGGRNSYANAISSTGVIVGRSDATILTATASSSTSKVAPPPFNLGTISVTGAAGAISLSFTASDCPWLTLPVTSGSAPSASFSFYSSGSKGGSCYVTVSSTGAMPPSTQVQLTYRPQ